MKYFIVIVFTVLFLEPISNVDKVRNQFPEITNKEQAEEFIKELKNVNCPEGKAYMAAMLFMKSRFVKFPFTKMKFFKEGKTLLDATINKNPKNIELRYIRFLMQKEIPDFLGYNKTINEDFELIINEFKRSNLRSKMKLKMVQYMLLTNDLTTIQKDKLNTLLNTV